MDEHKDNGLIDKITAQDTEFLLNVVTTFNAILLTFSIMDNQARDMFLEMFSHHIGLLKLTGNKENLSRSVDRLIDTMGKIKHLVNKDDRDNNINFDVLEEQLSKIK